MADSTRAASASPAASAASARAASRSPPLSGWLTSSSPSSRQARCVRHQPSQRRSIAAASARTAAERNVCADADVPIALGADEPPTLWLVDARRGQGLAIELAAPLARRLVLRDVLGEVVEDRPVRLAAGRHRLPVPPSGSAELRV